MYHRLYSVLKLTQQAQNTCTILLIKSRTWIKVSYLVQIFVWSLRLAWWMYLQCFLTSMHGPLSERKCHPCMLRPTWIINNNRGSKLPFHWKSHQVDNIGNSVCLYPFLVGDGSVFVVSVGYLLQSTMYEVTRIPRHSW